jgi:ATP synthase alpha/beta subunit-like protein
MGENAVRVAAKLLGSAAVHAPSWEEYLRRLPHDARWVVDEVTSPEDLWCAEAACRRREEADGLDLLRGGRLDATPVLAAAMVLSVDAWRVRAALESAARGGPAPEVLPRPGRRLGADAPLHTGQRALDLLFPLAKGATAAVPGGFGTGKTVLLQQIAK